MLRRRCAPSPVCDLRGRGPFRIVMAGLVPAIHVVANRKKGVDARVKPGHDESVGRLNRKSTSQVTAKIHDSSHAELAARSLFLAALASTAAEVCSLPLKGGGLGWGSDFRSRKRHRAASWRDRRRVRSVTSRDFSLAENPASTRDWRGIVSDRKSRTG